MVNSGILSFLAITLLQCLAIAGNEGTSLLTIRGRVVRPDGAPFGGFYVRVEERRWTESLVWSEPISTITAVDGAFCFEIARSRSSYHVVFGVGPDGRSQLRSQVVFDREADHVDLGDLPVETIEPWLSGCVVEENGGPLPGSLVAVDTRTGQYLLRTDENGEFVAPGIDWDAMAFVQARDGDRVSAMCVLEPGETRPVVVRLEVAPSIVHRGIVLDAEGNAVEGAELVANPVRPNEQRGRTNRDAVTTLASNRVVLQSAPVELATRSAAVTDSHGVFVLDPLPIGDILLRVTARGFVSKKIRLGDQEEPLLVTLEAELDVHGRAVLADRTTPVRVRSVDFASEAIRACRLDSAGDGSFRVRFGADLALFPYDNVRRECWVRADGFAPARLVVDKRSNGSDLPLVVFDEGRSLDVVVVDSAGRWVQDATVIVDFSPNPGVEPLATGSTDAAGRCRIEHLPDTSIQVLVTKADQPSALLRSVDVGKLDRSELRIDLQLGGFLVGQVTVDGQALLDPIDAFGTLAVEVNGSALGFDHLDLDDHSRFRSGPLPPGEYSIDLVGRLEVADFELWLDGEKVADLGDAWDYHISLRDGRTRIIELRLPSRSGP